MFSKSPKRASCLLLSSRRRILGRDVRIGVVPSVGPWRSWERASMASRRSWVRIPSAPPTYFPLFNPIANFSTGAKGHDHSGLVVRIGHPSRQFCHHSDIRERIPLLTSSGVNVHRAVHGLNQISRPVFTSIERLQTCARLRL